MNTSQSRWADTLYISSLAAAHLRPSPLPSSRRSLALCLAGLFFLPALTNCSRLNARASSSNPDTAVTDIAITTKVHLSGVKRLGINIGGQNFYDSGQMLRNLVFRNPGFEGETWQSILRCKTVTVTTCTDSNQYAVWPENFLKDARFEFISGPASTLSGTIQSSTSSHPSDPNGGITFDFPPLAHRPSAGDFVLVQFQHPGDADKGWWTNTMHSGAAFSTEFHDLAPNTPGRQALRIHASGPGQSARLDSYFDTYDGRSFLQLKGRYTFAFRAKALGGNNLLTVGILRTGTARGNKILFPERIVPLTAAWKDYTYYWTAAEDGTLNGHVDLSFAVSGADILLDDVSLTAAPAPDNPTAFRNEVVDTLRDLKPGILRYTDSGADTTSTIDNMIAPPFARMRAGYSTQATVQEQIPLGLHEALDLAKAVHAEPWYSLPATITPQEARNLIEYLAAPPTTPYGAKRALLGQIDPWTKVFTVIHLEFGNEHWNRDTFYGAAIFDPETYGQRAARIFAAARSSPSFTPDKFDLILGSFAVNPWWTSQELAHSAQYDSVAVAPYLFDNLVDTTSNEAIFGPMFAEPEMIDTLSSGYMHQQAAGARSAPHPARLEVYEVGLGTDQGDAVQSVVDAVVPSLGAGLTVTEHMLLMVRDLGITTQATYSLPGYVNKFRNPRDPSEHTPLWGMVVDMGGPTNMRRPLFLAEQLANQAILSTMLETRLTGLNPTWNQPRSRNSEIQIDQAHELQAFAFQEGKRRSLIVFNLNRVTARSITLSGEAAPSGPVAITQLTSPNITDTNEQKDVVHPVHSTLPALGPHTPYALPPFSMSVFAWSSLR